VKLTDELVSSLKISKLDNFELSYVNAVINMQDENDILLEPLPEADDHQPIFVGEVLLSEFRTLLQKEGYQTDFANGVLICNNEIAIKKVGNLPSLRSLLFYLERRLDTLR